MTELVAKLRWFPGDPLVEIREEDLRKLSNQYGASLSLEEVSGPAGATEAEMDREETMGSTIEEITQTVITVSSSDEGAFRETLREIFRIYRSPRPVYGNWGSSEKGKEIADDLMDENDGWF